MDSFAYKPTFASAAKPVETFQFRLPYFQIIFLRMNITNVNIQVSVFFEFSFKGLPTKHTGLPKIAKMAKISSDRDRPRVWICCVYENPRMEKLGHFGIVGIFIQVTYLCHSHLGPFWRHYCMVMLCATSEIIPLIELRHLAETVALSPMSPFRVASCRTLANKNMENPFPVTYMARIVIIDQKITFCYVCRTS